MKDTDNKRPSPVREAADRFGTVVRRGAGRLYPASLLCCAGFLPGFLLVWLGVASWQFWISLLGGALGFFASLLTGRSRRIRELEDTD